MYFALADLVSGFDPWWVIAAALLLIAVAAMLLDSEILLGFAWGILVWGMILIFVEESFYRMVAFPACLFLGYFGQVKVYRNLTLGTVPYEKSELGFLLETGTIRTTTTDNRGANFYYNYKDQVGHDSPPKQESVILTKVITRDGTVFPVRKMGLDFKDGDQVKIIAIENGAAVVEVITEI
jgi:hypothetical protein